jgi:hypothetical protein
MMTHKISILKRKQVSLLDEAIDSDLPAIGMAFKRFESTAPERPRTHPNVNRGRRTCGELLFI